MGEPRTGLQGVRADARKRILDAFDKSPGCELYCVEVAALLGIRPTRARSCLNGLEHSGELTSRHVSADEIEVMRLERSPSGLGRRYFRRAEST
jgi:predicted transcriptional regulator